MMSQRFSLFYAGYTAYAPLLYYGQLSFAQQYMSSEDQLIKRCVSEHCESLRDSEDENRSYLKTSMSIAKHFELPLTDAPLSPNEYFLWLKMYTEIIEQQFPMSRIDHYYFLYARKIAEILANLGLAECYIKLHLQTEKRLEVHAKIDKCMQDNAYILFKLIASAALLSSEPRHGFFNENYKIMDRSCAPFKTLNTTQLSDNELTKLKADLNTCSLLVKNEFKKCIGQLKELKV